MADRQEPADEWHQVGDLLGDQCGVMASPTALGRMLRQAVILLADPGVDEETVQIYRKLAAELEKVASRH